VGTSVPRNPPLPRPNVITIAVVSTPLRTSAGTGKKTAGGRQPVYRGWRYVVVTASISILLSALTAQYGNSANGPKTHDLVTNPVRSDEASTSQLQPLKVPDSQLEPIAWSALEGWTADDHGLAFATFLASCRPLLRSSAARRETRPMHLALKHVCGRALGAGRLAKEQARLFFERNFRPLRIAKLGDSAGLLTGYYEPIVDGSRFPSPTFKVPIYRRPPDLLPPIRSVAAGFPNKGQSLRRTSNGELVPYYDRGEILDGALDGKHLEICWIRDQADALMIQIEGSARVRLEDGTILRINYDAHNGYQFVPISRILTERNIIPRQEMSVERIREWMHANPEDAEKVRRENRSFMFFRIVGLSDDREAVGAQGIPLTPGRSIAVDGLLHVYGTPFFLQAGRPLTTEKRPVRLDRLMIAQDTGSAIVGPARADIFWGAGEQAGRLAGSLHHRATVAMLVPREVDPVTAAVRIPLPPQKPPLTDEANGRSSLLKPATSGRGHGFGQADEVAGNLRPQSRQQSRCSPTSVAGRTTVFDRTKPDADCRPSAKAAHSKEVAKRVLLGFAPAAAISRKNDRLDPNRLSFR